METRDLPVRLTDDELKIRADQLAQKVKDSKTLAEEKKSAMVGFKLRLDDIDVDLQALSTVVKARQEYRPVQCSWTEAANQMMDLFRNDTGEVIDSRPMTEAERQPRLFPVEDDKKRKRTAKTDEAINK